MSGPEDMDDGLTEEDFWRGWFLNYNRRWIVKSVGYWYTTALAPMQNVEATTEVLDNDGWEVLNVTSTNLIATAQSQIIDPNKPPQGVPVFMLLARKLRYAGQKRPELPKAPSGALNPVAGLGDPIDPGKVPSSK